MSMWASVGFQDGYSPQMEQLIYFHDYILIVIVVVMTMVGGLTLGTMLNRLVDRWMMESQMVEMIWTVMPVFILLSIAFPSLRLLYLLDEVGDVDLTLKVVGHQWYWSYNYSDLGEMEMDSYMLPSSESGKDQFRLLDVDNRVTLPFGVPLRILVSAADVIHAWTIPTLGIKVDGIPGRLNQVATLISSPGLFTGQCSEICGMEHSFMPIMIESISPLSFLKSMN